MLEVCESIAARRPRLEIHPLWIGGKADPVRLVFDAHPGPAVAASIVDMGTRFRMVATVVDVIDPPQPLPRLPVARAVWRPRPDLATNAAGWIYAGGSHHTSFGYAVTPEHLADFASMSRVEFVLIDEDTRARPAPRPAPLERPLLPPRQRALIIPAGRAGSSSHGPARIHPRMRAAAVGEVPSQAATPSSGSPISIGLLIGSWLHSNQPPS